MPNCDLVWLLRSTILYHNRPCDAYNMRDTHAVTTVSVHALHTRLVTAVKIGRARSHGLPAQYCCLVPAAARPGQRASHGKRTGYVTTQACCQLFTMPTASGALMPLQLGPSPCNTLGQYANAQRVTSSDADLALSAGARECGAPRAGRRRKPVYCSPRREPAARPLCSPGDTTRGTTRRASQAPGYTF